MSDCTADNVAGFIEFLASSPTPFHAVREMADMLESNGFEKLEERESWRFKPAGRYYLTRNGSSLIAFIHGRAPLADTGVRMIGAHTDSPCLKIKPEPDLYQHGYHRLGVEVYGGALLNPWFDRDLSIAGRVSLSNGGTVEHRLVDFADPVAVIPSLAIHLDREQNKAKTVNAQQHLPAVLSICGDGSTAEGFRAVLLEHLRKSDSIDASVKVLDFDLSLYDVQRPALVGMRGEFIAGARLDNLLSCYAGVKALLNSDGEASALLVCNDHEEVGSLSAVGAQGPMLSSFLNRLLPDVEPRERVLAASMLISADNAHGVHPNFAERHDETHGPVLNGGPVIKINASQRYATNSETGAVFRLLCEQEEIPVQSFVMRSDLSCGSTIGPITAAELGVRTLDVGVPTFGMHSIRELAGSEDLGSLVRALGRFVNLHKLPL